MKKAVKAAFVLTALFGMIAGGCGKTVEIGYVLTNPDKYLGRTVTVEGWVIHNFTEIREHEVKKAQAEAEYRRRGGLRPAYVRPLEYSYISSVRPESPFSLLALSAITSAQTERMLGNEKAGAIAAKYEASPPETCRKVRMKGPIKMKQEYGTMMPVIVVTEWKYVRSKEEKTRERYQKHIIE